MSLIPGINNPKVDGFIGVEGNYGGNSFYTEPAFQINDTISKDTGINNIERVEITCSTDSGPRALAKIYLYPDGSFLRYDFFPFSSKSFSSSGSTINFSNGEYLIEINNSKINFIKINGDGNINISFLAVGIK